MRAFILVLALVAAPAHAQFNLRDLNINKMLDTAKNVVKATSDIAEPEEISIGHDMAARLLGAAPLVNDPALQRYVNNVGRWLASQSERPNLPWQFGVLDAPEVNAFAVPGGTVFVTRGLVQHMQSEAQLAGVLAHEISHVLRKHHLKAIQKSAQTSLAGEALQQAIKDQPGLARDKLISLGSELYTRGLDKSDEFEADRLGVVIAARGGYDSYGLPAVLQTLQAMNAQDSALAMMFKTHPSPTDRLGALSERMQPVLDQYATQPQLPERFATETKKLR
jgi:predicted Zn-dependent protease